MREVCTERQDAGLIFFHILLIYFGLNITTLHLKGSLKKQHSMPIYKLENDKIMELHKTTFSNEKIDEVRSLQKM
jgi:hypothetical protein